MIIITNCIKLKKVPFSNFKAYRFEIIKFCIVQKKLFSILHTKKHMKPDFWNDDLNTVVPFL